MLQAMLLLLLVALTSSPEQNEAIAQLKWEQANVQTYVRGTVPVPGFVTPPSWVLVDQTGREHATQLETVTRGADGESLIYEVIAMLPASDEVQGRAYLRLQSEAPKSPLLAPPHESLPSALVLSARDANGHLYTARITDSAPSQHALTTLKSGSIHREDKHSLVMTPDGDEKKKSSQKHLFGVHAYLGSWVDAKFLTLDLRVHNALIGDKAEESPIGPLYFDSLSLALPEGWTALSAVEDPFQKITKDAQGRPLLNIVAANKKDGESSPQRLHMLPPGASFHRRLVIFPEGDPLSKNAAEAHLSGKGWAVSVPGDGLYSWSNPLTANYFPQRELLPDLSNISAPVGKRAANLLERLKPADETHARQLSSGEPGQGAYRSGVMGWAHPWFRPSGGGHGGEGITFIEGLRALSSGAPNELRRLRLLHRANTSRHGTGAWRASGTPAHIEEWLNEEGELPFAYHMKANAHHKALRLPCEGGPPLDESIASKLTKERRPIYDQSEAILKNGKRPANADDILAWHPHDGAHIIRYTAHAKALAWLSNDSLAIDALMHEAERFRFALPNTPSTSPPLTSIYQLNAFAEEHPNHGLPVGRELGWALDTTSAAYTLGDDVTRARLLPWIKDACATVVKGTPATGITTRNDHAPLSIERRHAIAHTFQTAILQLGLRSAHRSCLSSSDPDLSGELTQLFMSCVDSIYFGQVFDKGPSPLETWPATGSPSGPRWIFPVAPLDWRDPPYDHDSKLPADGFDGGVETAYSNALLSWAHINSQRTATPTQKYKERILELGPRYKSWGDWVEHLARKSRGRAGLDMLSQAAPALLLADSP